MPITPGGDAFDLRGVITRLWVEDARGDDSYYRARSEADRVEREQREARRERLRAIARLKRPNVAKRPWQAAGFVRKQDWLDAGSPGPTASTDAVEPVDRTARDQAVEPTRREKAEARLRARKR